MAAPSSGFSILLCAMDPSVQSHFQRLFSDNTLTVISQDDALSTTLSQRTYDVVILESQPDSPPTSPLLDQLDPSQTLFVTGSPSTLIRMSERIRSMGQKELPSAQGAARDLSLEEYLDAKMGDFIKGMRHGAAKNLHPMLISALERPLISLALRETHGNQIQAAELLGLNRNTLRKKITDLDIPVKRTRSKASRSAADIG